MSKKDKLTIRLLKKPKDFSFKDLVVLLKSLGYNEIKRGKTSGSRRAFINLRTNHVIRLHKPHPVEVLKLYQIEYIIEELSKEDLL